MKKIITASIIFLFSYIGSSQGFNYQAQIRDSSGNILAGQSISIQFSITLPPPASTVNYKETHNLTTSPNAMITAIIGQGSYVSGTAASFAGLDWAGNQYWLSIEVDLAGGSNYTLMGSQQIMSVPYAKYAEQAGTINKGGSDAKTLLFLEY